jgi:hypothetical protein
MQALERVRVVGGRNLLRLEHRFEGGPKADYEAVTYVDAWLRSRLECSYRAVGLR